MAESSDRRNKDVREKRKTGKKRRKKKWKKVVVSVVVIVLAAGGAGSAFFIRNKNAADYAQKSVQTAQSATAKIGSISNTIVGTGNIAMDDAQALYVPSGIQIAEVMVESGDHVAKGQTLATVDETSVLKAMKQIQEEILELDEKISGCQESDEENTIESGVSGRVKLINAAEGLQVIDVMLEKGSLMVLSLDGKMAVDLSMVTGVREGDTVIVVRTDGTQEEGEVEAVSGNRCTVVLDDELAEYDEMVTVSDSDGKELGSGTLYIHQPLEIMGTTGTVEEVNVSINGSVEAGTVLFTLSDANLETEYRELMAERQEKSETLKKLLTLTQNLNITAEQSGTIQEVNVASSSGESSQASSDSAEETIRASQMSFEFGDIGFISDAVMTGEGVPQSADMDGERMQEELPAPSGTALTFAVKTSGENNASVLAVTPPVAGEIPQADASAADGTYTGTITWNPPVSVFENSTSYQALVVLYASDGYIFRTDSIASVELGTVSGVHVSGDGKTLEFQIAFPQTGEGGTSDQNEKKNNGTEPDSEETDGFISETEGSTDKNGTGTSGNTNTGTTGNTQGSSGTSGGTQGSSGTSGGTQGSSGTSGGTQSGSAAGTSGSSQTTAGSVSASGTSFSSSVSSDSSYSTDVTAFTISPDENMLLSVSVDELDINSVELGQEAVVTFDAIEDEEFTGKVTSIGNQASVSGGVAKYTVILTVPRDERMREGMNASATITIESRENIVTLPMNALQEQGDRTFVYTRQNEDGTLTGEKDVTTGLSDGSTVEITEGLSEGDTVYYQKTGNTQSSSGGFSLGGFGNIGGMPDMGSMGENRSNRTKGSDTGGNAPGM